MNNTLKKASLAAICALSFAVANVSAMSQAEKYALNFVQELCNLANSNRRAKVNYVAIARDNKGNIQPKAPHLWKALEQFAKNLQTAMTSAKKATKKVNSNYNLKNVLFDSKSLRNNFIKSLTTPIKDPKNKKVSIVLSKKYPNLYNKVVSISKQIDLQEKKAQTKAKDSKTKKGNKANNNKPTNDDVLNERLNNQNKDGGCNIM